MINGQNNSFNPYIRNSQQNSQSHRHDYRHGHGQSSRRGSSTGAPIDGGLLTILGAAGIAYYGLRRNKKKSV